MSNSCKDCRRPLKWNEQKLQFRRLKLREVADDDIKELLPRCQKCITVHLKETAPEVCVTSPQ